MALLPIDLQTLFSQTTLVGKEQAAQKDALPVAQSIQGAQLAQKAEIRDTAVNETHDEEEGAEKAGDRTRRGAERRKRQQKGAKAAVPPAPSADVVRDPALGRNVDITS